MLQLLDEAIEDLLRAAVPLARGDVDVNFVAPDGGNGSTRALPSVNVLLWGVHRSASRNAAGVEVVEIDGRLQRRGPLPALDCHYLVSAWASDPRDEHNLLGAVLAALLEHPEIPEEHLKGTLATVGPAPSLSIGNEVPRQGNDLLSAAGQPLKAAFELVATVTVDAALVHAAGPPVQRYETRLVAGDAASDRILVTGTAPGVPAGTRVWGPGGESLVGDDGRFALPARPGDEITVATDPPRRRPVPAGGTMTLD